MKTINVRSNQAEGTIQTAGSWPECVEDSYERLVAAVTNFVSSERNDTGMEPTLNRFSL
jgi:hypothetical protein